MIYIMRGVYSEEQQQYQYLQNTKIYLQTQIKMDDPADDG